MRHVTVQPRPVIGARLKHDVPFLDQDHAGVRVRPRCWQARRFSGNDLPEVHLRHHLLRALQEGRRVRTEQTEDHLRGQEEPAEVGGRGVVVVAERQIERGEPGRVVGGRVGEDADEAVRERCSGLWSLCFHNGP